MLRWVRLPPSMQFRSLQLVVAVDRWNHQSSMGHGPWKSSMDDEMGHGSWKSSMDDDMGHGSWKSLMDDEMGHGSWKSSMDDDMGHGSWKSSMDAEMGHGSWLTPSMRPIQLWMRHSPLSSRPPLLLPVVQSWQRAALFVLHLAHCRDPCALASISCLCSFSNS